MRRLSRKTKKYLNFATGVALILYLHVLATVALYLYYYSGSNDTFGERYSRGITFALLIGNLWLWQWVYALPIAGGFIINRRREVAKGILAGSTITALINISGCFIVGTGGSPPFVFGTIAIALVVGFIVIIDMLKE
ncbi:MAG: hypothetical protein RLZZ511_3871 [Cyanobacteriota bacterium]|jgi:peptidoglycan/LPS O-acetylase OafA/YrhL